MQPTVIVARDLDEAWFLTLKEAFEPLKSRKYVIDKGSFEGHTRYQIGSLTLLVTFPATRPLSPIMPSGVEPVTTDEYIEQYFSEYIMNPEKAPNEEYTYGQFIFPHLDIIVDLLQRTPHTNQAVINIGESLTTDGDLYAVIPKIYENPPCLRCISFMYREGYVDLHSFWRSWDIHSGLPTNLGGLQLLNEYVADSCGYKSGRLYAYSSGAHCYDYAKSSVESRLGKKLGW